MLAQLIWTLRHLFLPHHTNNHRPKLLYPQSLLVLSAVVLGLNSTIGVFAQVSGGVLGYASDISVAQVLEKTNAKRSEQGLKQLVQNDRLSDAARRKASDMFTFDYWAHTNPKNGTEPWNFFDAAGYHYRFAGENLARDFATTDPMVQAWIDSPTHRENLLSSRYEETGIAVVNGVLGGMETTLVVMLFGTQQRVAAVPQVSATSTDNLEKEAASPKGAPEPENVEGGQPASVSGTSPTSQVAISQETNSRYQPWLSPFDISKSITLATLLLVGGVILVDSLLVWQRKTHRLAGRNWAHLVFLGGLILVVATLGQGVIQ